MIYQKFYKELGKLLYAISAADGNIQPQEEKVLEEMINKELCHHQPYFDKHPESKEIILTKLHFYNSRRENLSTKEACESYKSFFSKYGKKLNVHQKELAAALISRIAAAYKGINQEERKLIDEIIVSKNN